MFLFSQDIELCMHIMTSKIEASKYTHAQESYIVFDAPQHAQYNYPHFHGVGTFSTLHGVGTAPCFHGLGIFYGRCTLTCSIQPSSLPRCRTFSTLARCRNLFLKISMFQNISLKIQFDTDRLVLIFISNVKCLKMSSFFKLSLLGFNLIALIQSKIFKTTLIL